MDTTPAPATAHDHDDVSGLARAQHAAVHADVAPPAHPRQTPGMLAATVARGFAMGSADLVPGVSGGTVALVLGIYDRLIASVRQGARALGRAPRGDVSGFVRELGRVEWAFFLPLVAGIGLAIVALAGPLTHLLETQPIAMSALFAGLVVGSIVIAHGELATRDAEVNAIVVGVTLLAFVLLGLRSAAVVDPPLPLFFAAGAVAICAMILPGISGSFILLMLGMYAPVLDAVDGRDLAVIGVFALGATLGLGGFSTVLNWALANHRDRVLAVLIGLMIGSLRVLWPWPAGDLETHVGETALGAPGADVPLALGLFVLATAVVVVVGRLGERRAPDGATG